MPISRTLRLASSTRARKRGEWWCATPVSGARGGGGRRPVVADDVIEGVALDQQDQVLHALGARLDVAVEQRAVGGDPHPMGDPMDLEPALGSDLLMEDLPAHALAEHFRAAPGQRVEADLAQALEHPFRR